MRPVPVPVTKTGPPLSLSLWPPVGREGRGPCIPAMLSWLLLHLLQKKAGEGGTWKAKPAGAWLHGVPPSAGSIPPTQLRPYGAPEERSLSHPQPLHVRAHPPEMTVQFRDWDISTVFTATGSQARIKQNLYLILRASSMFIFMCDGLTVTEPMWKMADHRYNHHVASTKFSPCVRRETWVWVWWEA